ncbi:MAG: hypothetical protein COA49_02000 [Bacteroidetes bacterium]|nr:MAG: hypothetical protein COA49_02000 [Bacteroidota bacterium]
MRLIKCRSVVIASVIMTVSLYSCTVNDDGSQNSGNKQKEKVVTIANPPSQLAQLMRYMDERLIEIEVASEQSDDWPNLKFNFPDISEQEPTRESMLSDAVFEHSVSFQKISEEYNTAPSKEGFDKIVQECLACHYRSCPGPIVRIKKHLD